MNYSVLMSVYFKENPEYLDFALNSMVNQTIITNDFVIIKDGPLTDELNNVIEKYQNRYPNIFNIISIKNNVGLGSALEIGVKNCKNEWIARMDSDDYCLPTRCEKQIEYINNKPDVDIIGTYIVEFEENINNIISYRKLPSTNEEIYSYSKRRNPFGHPSVMFKKSKVLESGNYRECYLCEDYDLWIRMLKNGANCYNLKENLVYMRIGKEFYKRRGGIKYLRSILKFKKRQYDEGFFSFSDYIISSTAHFFICLIPNRMRTIFYKKFLRK